jgi:D-glycero-alpha-D-manno-heptose-7-phosphate kinase
MILCQTPLRVSFFGGGTDFPEFFGSHGGAVLATAIDKYIIHAVNPFHAELFDYNLRLAYRRVECVKNRKEIKHAPFREILGSFDVERGVEVTLTADMPAFSGLGSSSSFTVGLINALSAHQGKFIAKEDLARAAIRMERQTLRETVGFQDQITAAYGGTNVIEFSGQDRFEVHKVSVSEQRLHQLDSQLLLFFTGLTRKAGRIEKKKKLHKPSASSAENLKRIRAHVDKAHAALVGSGPLSVFGELLDQTWKEKRALSAGVTTPAIDSMYAKAKAAGALGGKLLGAGGGGFMLFFVPPERQAKVRKALSGSIEEPFTINAQGSRIIHS